MTNPISPVLYFNMDKKLYFISGMPRSGSTLLCNILNQNPRFHATGTSPAPALLWTINNMWIDSPEAKAAFTVRDKVNAMRGALNGLHSRISKPIIFDKSRGWVSAVELIEGVLEEKPKIIVTIRDFPSILSSCEKLFRKELGNPDSQAKFGSNMETVEGRLRHWTSSDQLIGSSYNRIRDCVMRGHRKSLHFVDFDDLTSSPEETIKEVYKFLEEEYFTHDFNNVEQVTEERDYEHGFLDLHTIRRQVKPVKKDYKDLFGDAIKPYLRVQYDFID